MNILIVDDRINEDMLALFEDDRVTVAADVTAALAQLHEQLFDVVLLDMQMPDRHGELRNDAGLEVLDWVRCMRPETAVVVITGFGNPTNAIDSVERGIRAYISKKASPQQVIAFVHQAGATTPEQRTAARTQFQTNVAEAAIVQRFLFPTQVTLNTPEGQQLTVAGRNLHAALASGDMFDIVLLPERSAVAFFLLDVQGHGLGPALIGSRFAGLFRAGLRRQWTLLEITMEFDGLLNELSQATVGTPRERHFNAEGVLGYLDLTTRQLHVVRATGRPISHRTGAGTTWALAASHGFGPKWGLQQEMGYPEMETLTVQPGESLVLFTDGVVDRPSQNTPLNALTLAQVQQSHGRWLGENAQQLADHVLYEMFIGLMTEEVQGVAIATEDDATILSLVWHA